MGKLLALAALDSPEAAGQVIADTCDHSTPAKIQVVQFHNESLGVSRAKSTQHHVLHHVDV